MGPRDVDSLETPSLAEVSQSEVNWNPLLGLIFALITFGLITTVAVPVIVYSILTFAGRTSEQASNTLQSGIIWQFVAVLLAEGGLVWAVWWFLRRHKRSLRVIGLRRLRWSDPAAALAGFGVYFVAYIVLLSVVMHYVPAFNAGQKQELGFDHVHGTSNMLLTFVSLVMIPPVAEEVLFRGFIFTSLRKNLRFAWSALITGLLFAVAHLEFGSGRSLVWVAALDTFTLSLVLCYLREKTNRLWPGIFLHALKNSIAFISLYLLHLG